jgi:hypothetical protein
MKVKVWNDNIYPYEEKFRDRQIQIPSKGFIEMEYDEAVLFKGSFSSPVRGADGEHLARGYKMIRIEEEASAPLKTLQKDPETMCQVCRYLAKTKEDLDLHLGEHAHLKASDPEAEAEIVKRANRAPKQVKAG